MRHRNKINSLGRKAAHRKKTMSSMATALILHKRINTTIAKAKALRSYVEPLITRSKEDTTHSRRTVFAYLRNKYAVTELFREISQKVADRPGGYTRILKTGFRKGDGAEMCFIELVDYNTHMLKTEEDTQQKRTRRGRRRGKKDADAETAAQEAPQAAATATEEVEQPEATAGVAERAPEAEAEITEPPANETEEIAPEAETPVVPEQEAKEKAEVETEAETPTEAKKEEADESAEDEKTEGATDQADSEDKPGNK